MTSGTDLNSVKEIDNARGGTVECAAAPAAQLEVWLVGGGGHLEFSDAVDLLRRTSTLRCFGTAEESLHELSSGRPTPDVLLLAQARPGEIAVESVEKLLALLSGAEFCALLGSWCEGETRTGQPWAGVRRCYTYEFPHWWRLFVRQWDWQAERRATATIWSKFPPGVATGSSLPHRGLVVIDSPRHDCFEALADCLREAGLAALWRPRHAPLPPVTNPMAGIWDGGQLTQWEIPQLKDFCEFLGQCPRGCVALLDFPRHDRIALARQLGVATVLGKPWRETDLWQALALAEPIAEPQSHQVQEEAA